MPTLFVYGTLKNEKTQKEVFMRSVKGATDVLGGFRKIEGYVEGKYPAIIRNPKSSVKGLVLEVSRKELSLVDEYEGSAYKRIRATTKSGKKVWVYKARIFSSQ